MLNTRPANSDAPGRKQRLGTVKARKATDELSLLIVVRQPFSADPSFQIRIDSLLAYLTLCIEVGQLLAGSLSRLQPLHSRAGGCGLVGDGHTE